MSLDGKVVIVTGAGSGIGRETAKLLSATGAQVVIAEINEASGNSTLKEIQSAGGSARFVQTDVGNEQSVRRKPVKKLNHVRYRLASDSGGQFLIPKISDPVVVEHPGRARCLQVDLTPLGRGGCSGCRCTSWRTARFRSTPCSAGRRTS